MANKRFPKKDMEQTFVSVRKWILDGLESGINREVEPHKYRRLQHVRT